MHNKVKRTKLIIKILISLY